MGVYLFISLIFLASFCVLRFPQQSLRSLASRSRSHARCLYIRDSFCNGNTWCKNSLQLATILTVCSRYRECGQPGLLIPCDRVIYDSAGLNLSVNWSAQICGLIMCFLPASVEVRFARSSQGRKKRKNADVSTGEWLE